MEVSTRLTAGEGRKFAFTVGIAFCVLGAISAWRGHVIPPRVLLVLGGALLVAGTLVPGRLTPVYRAWMGLAERLSKVTTPILMGVIYFLILTPTGVLMRLLGYNPLRRRERDGGFWVAASSGGRSDLDTQF